MPRESTNVAPLFNTPFALEYLFHRNVLLVGARHDEVVNFTPDKNPTISVVVLVYASLLFAALKSATG